MDAAELDSHVTRRGAAPFATRASLSRLVNASTRERSRPLGWPPCAGETGALRAGRRRRDKASDSYQMDDAIAPRRERPIGRRTRVLGGNNGPSNGDCTGDWRDGHEMKLPHRLDRPVVLWCALSFDRTKNTGPQSILRGGEDHAGSGREDWPAGDGAVDRTGLGCQQMALDGPTCRRWGRRAPFPRHSRRPGEPLERT